MECKQVTTLKVINLM